MGWSSGSCSKTLKMGTPGRPRGRLIAWDSASGKGAAALKNVSDIIFISQSALRAPLNSLTIGQYVEFTLGTSAYGLVGTDVTLAPNQKISTFDVASCAKNSAAVGGSRARARKRAAARTSSPAAAFGNLRKRPRDTEPDEDSQEVKEEPSSLKKRPLKKRRGTKLATQLEASTASHPCAQRPAPPPLKTRLNPRPDTTARLRLGTSTAPSVDLEPQIDPHTTEAEGSNNNGPSIAQRLAKYLAEHELLRDDPDAALAAAYASTVTAFATAQLGRLHADHLSSHHAQGVVASDTDDAGAARIDTMQRMVLSWKDTPSRPTSADLKAAHAALIVVGGGQTRTTGVCVGNTRFSTHHRDVPAKLEELTNALSILTARNDLSAVAKAGWAGVQFISLHPFADGNGRIARALVNLFLARGGVPFVVGFAASDTQRDAYRAALIASHKLGISRPFAAIAGTSVRRGWVALNALWASAKGPAVAAAGAISRSHSASAMRERARGDPCMICLDELPNCTLLCCGGIFHVRCLGRWLNDSNRRTCPQCRAHVPVAEDSDQHGGVRGGDGGGGGRDGVLMASVRDQEDDSALDGSTVDDSYFELDGLDLDEILRYGDGGYDTLDEADAEAEILAGTIADDDDTTAEAEVDDTAVEAEVDDTAVEVEVDDTATLDDFDDAEAGAAAAHDDTTVEADDTVYVDDTTAEPEADDTTTVEHGARWVPEFDGCIDDTAHW
jgi:hypothetical protein